MKKYFICIPLMILILVNSCAINTLEGELVEQTKSVGILRKELPKSVLPYQDESLFTGEVKSFNMIAKRFVFEPNEIIVQKGDKVRLTITSIDTTHGFAISEYGININIISGETITKEFIADKKGQFNFVCSVFCGSGHGEMKGRLIVT